MSANLVEAISLKSNQSVKIAAETQHLPRSKQEADNLTSKV